MKNFFEKVFKKVGDGVEDMRRERARRLSNPALQAELLRQRNEMMKELGTSLSSTASALVKFLVFAPISSTGIALKGIFDDKTTGAKMIKESLDEFGKAWPDTKKAVINGLSASGRAVGTTFRWLIGY